MDKLMTSGRYGDQALLQGHDSHDDDDELVVEEGLARSSKNLAGWCVRASKNSVIVRSASRLAANTNSEKSVKSVYDNWANRK